MASNDLTIVMQGGLGNQLFQIATLYAYAKRHRRPFGFPKAWSTGTDRKPIWTTYLKDNASFNLHDFFLNCQSRYNEPSFGYCEIPPPPPGIHQLHGYFQSSKYFNDYADEIKKLLKPSEFLSMKASAVLEMLGILDLKNCIVAHVRRGDYLKSTASAAYHATTTAEYFTGARRHIEAELGVPPAVLWITEDPGWVYQNVYEEGDRVWTDTETADFTVLAQFKNMILSNSSFSWWAAWLNPGAHQDRIICCPDKWFGPTGPSDYADVFEPDWVRIDTTSGKVSAQL